MNFVFDIGNVLVDFKPEIFLKGFIDDATDRNRINEIIFKSSEWIELDRGTITAEEAGENFCNREPQYRDLIGMTMARIPEMLTLKEETAKMLPKVKAAGHGLYYLSNYHKDLSRFIQNKYDIFTLFDGGVFSCDVRLIKPSAEIYEFFLEKYQLTPETCLFIDDTAENVTGAQKVGMKGVVFTEACALASYI
ncbi:MAG: HAD family phosphatase [Eubacteriales bacterium]